MKPKKPTMTSMIHDVLYLQCLAAISLSPNPHFLSDISARLRNARGSIQKAEDSFWTKRATDYMTGVSRKRLSEVSLSLTSSGNEKFDKLSHEHIRNMAVEEHNLDKSEFNRCILFRASVVELAKQEAIVMRSDKKLLDSLGKFWRIDTSYAYISSPVLPVSNAPLTVKQLKGYLGNCPDTSLLTFADGSPCSNIHLRENMAVLT